MPLKLSDYPSTLGGLRDLFTREWAAFTLDVFALPKHTLRICEVLRSDEQAAINAFTVTERTHLVQVLSPEFPNLAKRIENNVGRGILNSLHTYGLACDAQLFVDGNWLSKGSEPEWQKVGTMWEKRGALHRWGGRFNDANHFSIEYHGIK